MSQLSRVNVIAAMLVFSALPTVAKHPPWLFCLLAISLLLLAVGLTTKSAVSVCACTLTALTALAWTAEDAWLPWPLSFCLPLAVFFGATWSIASLRRVMPRFELGAMTPPIWARLSAIVVVSSLGLWLWLRFLGADVSDIREMVPDAPFIALLAGGLAFALLNAAMEEAQYRFTFMGLLGRAGVSPWLNITLQGFAFGLHHYGGFPRGISGLLLATVYGLMLGELRVAAGGMLAPFVAHVCADLVIFALLLTLA